MESQLCCPICNIQYSQQKQPRILNSCGHTFCEVCLQTKIISLGQNQYKIVCPQDDLQCEIANNDVKQFPLNRSLLKIIEANKSKTCFRDSSLDNSKLTKQEELQNDQDAKQLMNVIKESQQQEAIISNKNKGQLQQQNIEEDQSEDEENICLLHQKPLEIVCIIDLEKICAKCALFGEHKGHDFKSIEQIQQQKNVFYSQLLAVHEQKKDIINRIQNKTTKHDIVSILATKKSILQKQIKERFRKLLQLIKNQQKNALAKLEKIAQKIEKDIDGLYNIDPQTIKKSQKWEKLSLQKLKIVEDGSFENQLQLLFRRETDKQRNTVSFGRQVIEAIRLHQQNIINQAQNFLSNVSIKTSDQIFHLVQNFVEVIDTPHVKIIVNQKEQIFNGQANVLVPKIPSLKKSIEDDLLDIEATTQDTLRQFKNRYISQPVKNVESFDIKINEVKLVPFLEGKIFDEKPNKKSEKKLPLNATVQNLQKVSQFSYDNNPSSRHTSRQNSFISDKLIRPSKKKLKNIKVPEKYEKILDDLYADTKQVLDLTNAELGDNTIFQISQFIPGTKVKSVKFIRNKLTDDGLSRLLPFLSNVITLNLSQNMLTQRVLDILIANRQILPKIKSIILSLNKIIERKHKAKIDELRKLDITVSV